MVALTGIEGAWREFSSVHLGVSCTKYVQLVSRRQPETPPEPATLSLGCHSPGIHVSTLPPKPCARGIGSNAPPRPELDDIDMDLPPFLTQPVKTQNPLKGRMSHGVVEKDVHQGVQAGCRAAAGAREFHRRGGAGA